MGKVNIAEILKNCPKGTKLYSPICGECEFDSIRENMIFVVASSNKILQYSFRADGCYCIEGECLLFPSKENRDWDKFQIPFKKGDIVVVTGISGIDHTLFYISKFKNYVTGYSSYGDDLSIDSPVCYVTKTIRHATEEEKQKLFDAIKANGYKWNAEKKILEELVKPKFKVGDRVRHCRVEGSSIYRIVKIEKSKYVAHKNIGGCDYHIDFEVQDDWELVHNKFDISTLKPFDKVIGRDDNTQVWRGSFFSHYSEIEEYPYACTDFNYSRCIPYKGNEHLLGTTNDCDDYYKTWE